MKRVGYIRTSSAAGAIVLVPKGSVSFGEYPGRTGEGASNT